MLMLKPHGLFGGGDGESGRHHDDDVRVHRHLLFHLLPSAAEAAERAPGAGQEPEAGDKVSTIGGIVGEIVHLSNDIVTIKSGDTRVEVQRSKIGSVNP